MGCRIFCTRCGVELLVEFQSRESWDVELTTAVLEKCMSKGERHVIGSFCAHLVETIYQSAKTQVILQQSEDN